LILEVTKIIEKMHYTAQWCSTGLQVGCSGVWVLAGAGNFSLHHCTSRPDLGPTQPLSQWVPGALALGVKRPGPEADHSPPSSAKVKDW